MSPEPPVRRIDMTNTRQIRPHRHNQGFTLIEVLVALLVLSIGLLGLAGMQSYGLQNNHQSYLRSQAMLIAYDMADRMRANPTGVSSYVMATNDTSADPGCISTGCTAAQLATYDKWDWNTNYVKNTTLLPGGSASVTDNANSTYTIVVTWNERTGSAVSGQSMTNASTQTSITLVFRPL